MSDLIQARHDAMRVRVIETAQGLFEAYGYNKTTVADIARALDMSPANVYRFFESKREIMAAITHNHVQQYETDARAVAFGPGKVADRFRKLVVFLEEATRTRYLANPKLRELVSIAMAESWPEIDAHIDRMRLLFRDIIEAGITSGEFPPQAVDPVAGCCHAAVILFTHPVVLAECDRKGEDSRLIARVMAEFLLSALKAGFKPG